MNLQITGSCPSRFGMVDQMRELSRLGVLKRLIHGYPTWHAQRWGIPRAQLESLLAIRAYGQLLWYTRSLMQPSRHERRSHSFHVVWTRAVAARLRPDSAVFIGLSGFSLEAMRRAQRLGMFAVVEHGSLHERVERRAIDQEYRTWNLPLNATWPPDWLIERETAEFMAADMVVVQSRVAAATLIAEGVPKDKLFVNPLGVDLSAFHPSPERSDGVFRVIQCGAVSPRKGVAYLVRAFAELNLPRSELWLVGEASPEMRGALQPYLRDNIHFKGSYPQHELADLYGRCSVAVLASVADGFGMVVPQAMACRVPVVVTDHVGAADLVVDGENGFVVPARSVEAIKQRLMELYDQPRLRSAMADRALATVAAGNTWADNATRLVDHLTARLQPADRGRAPHGPLAASTGLS